VLDSGQDKVRMIGQERPDYSAQGKPLRRREFLKGITLLGGLALLSALMPSCLRRDEPVPGPASLPDTPDLPVSVKEENMVSKIGLVCTRNRMEGVPKAISLFQSNPVQGKAVVLKPNFNSADAAPGSAHGDTLRALILALQEMGAARITLAERSGPGDTTHQVMEKKGSSAWLKSWVSKWSTLKRLAQRSGSTCIPRIVTGRMASTFRGSTWRQNASYRPVA